MVAKKTFITFLFLQIFPKMADAEDVDSIVEESTLSRVRNAVNENKIK